MSADNEWKSPPLKTADIVPVPASTSPSSAGGPPGPSGSLQPRAGVSAAFVGLAMLAMNVMAIALMVLVAHDLGPSTFSTVAVLLGVVVVANVGSLTMQATAARRLGTAEADELAGVRSGIVHAARWCALALGLLLVVGTPLIDTGLELDDWVATAMVAPACAAATMVAAYAGICQGERRWGPLAALYLTLGLCRLIGVGVALRIDSSLRSAMIGLAVGSVLALLVGWRLCASTPAAATDIRSLVSDVWRSGQTLLAFLVFTNLDLLLSRSLFADAESGLYAGGTILTRTCLFVATFVLVVAFPSMAAGRERRAWLRPVLLMLVLGGLLVAGARLLPDVAESFAGGTAYVGLGHAAWVFVAEGTMFAVLQIMVYTTVAGQTHAATVLWAGSIAVAVAARPAADSAERLALVVAAVAAAAALVIAALPALRWRSGTESRP